ncbi:hypothetical protein, partial [Aeromonas hydrophila]|uniref:hypothetical protein n=1 Tax=Aeromonas hydrophila TaxID=644 RepID=UPI001CC81699
MGVFRRPPSGGSIHCRGRLIGAAPLKTGHQKPYFDSSKPEIDTTPSRIKNKVLMYQNSFLMSGFQ